MAVHRRPVEFVPPRLLRFNPKDWQSWDQWCNARFQWLLEHPWQLLGGSDVVDVIFEMPAAQ
jgi:hypothetical protein